MYCRKCYAKLDADNPFHRCGRCDLAFDPGNPSSYLQRPFPSRSRILVHILLTTLIGGAAAFVVATFQMAAASGH